MGHAQFMSAPQPETEQGGSRLSVTRFETAPVHVPARIFVAQLSELLITALPLQRSFGHRDATSAERPFANHLAELPADEVSADGPG
ncbi:MAG TPA: hypothetical protein VMF86_10655 [Stellaceae bacterium]|nr:hypothetical protein [Stellaceae bacterium]